MTSLKISTLKFCHNLRNENIIAMIEAGDPRRDVKGALFHIPPRSLVLPTKFCQLICNQAPPLQATPPPTAFPIYLTLQSPLLANIYIFYSGPKTKKRNMVLWRRPRLTNVRMFTQRKLFVWRCRFCQTRGWWRFWLIAEWWSHTRLWQFFLIQHKEWSYTYMYVLKTKECLILMTIQNSFVEEYDL